VDYRGITAVPITVQLSSLFTSGFLCIHMIVIGHVFGSRVSHFCELYLLKLFAIFSQSLGIFSQIFTSSHLCKEAKWHLISFDFCKVTNVIVR